MPRTNLAKDRVRLLEGGEVGSLPCLPTMDKVGSLGPQSLSQLVPCSVNSTQHALLPFPSCPRALSFCSDLCKLRRDEVLASGLHLVKAVKSGMD